MEKRNRLIALALALTVVFVMLLSVCFVIAEADHDCVGDDCPVCSQIAACDNTLRSVFRAVTVFFPCVFACIASAVPAFSAVRPAGSTSPISLRVKLSN